MAIETRAQKITKILILGLLVDNVDKEEGSVFKYFLQLATFCSGVLVTVFEIQVFLE